MSSISCFNGSLTLIARNHKTVLLDPGHLGRRVSAPYYIIYTLTPELIRKGIRSLDIVIALKPSATVFKALDVLCTQFIVKAVYIPSWQGKLTHSGWQAWEHFLATVQKYNIVMHFIDKSLVTLTLSPTESLTITPTNKALHKNKLRYRQITVTGISNNTSLNITNSPSP